MASRDPANEAAATFLIPVTALALASLVGLLLIVGGRTRRSPLAALDCCRWTSCGRLRLGGRALGACLEHRRPCLPEALGGVASLLNL